MSNEQSGHNQTDSDDYGVRSAVRIVFATNKLELVRDLTARLRNEEENDEYKDRMKVFPASSTLKILELCQNYEVDLVIVEECFVDTMFEEWVQKVNRVSQAKNPDGFIPPIMVVLEAEKKPFELRQLLGAGFKDIMVKPYDMPIVLQKLDRLIPTKMILSESQLYRMDCSEEVNLATPMVIQKISETEVIILSTREVRVNEIVSLYAKPFGESVDKEIVAICTFCKKQTNMPNSKYPYQATFQLQGITAALSTSIRKWIKVTCVRKNEAS